MITHKELLSLISYNKITGVVTWKVKPCKNMKAGVRAGTVCISRKKKYRSIRIQGICKREHCWVSYYVNGVYPETEIDHKDGNGENNKWNNLRHVTSSVNRHNHRKYSHNKSGVTGVFFSKDKNSWCVVFSIEGKQKRIAQRKDFFEACCIRKSLENKNGYSQQHGSDRSY